MKTTLQNEIEAANRKVQAGRNRQFAKRATDSQMLDSLASASRSVISLARVELKGVILGEELRTALRALETATALAERRSK